MPSVTTPNSHPTALTESGSFHTIGDPTEGALVVAAAQNDIAPAAVRSQFPRIAELPFDSDRKRMTTVHHVPGTSPRPGTWVPSTPYLAITKGAVDGLLDLSTAVWRDGQVQPMTPADHAEIAAANDELAANGMRVLGVAFRPLATPSVENVEQDLVFLGLVAMIDPPRPEVRAAVARCIAAGIRPIMITGDHPLTASYIARDLGIATDDTGPHRERYRQV